MDVFDGLADPTRRRLLVALASGARTAGELADTEPISRPAISRHLRVLLESGLAEVEPEGRRRLYRLREDAVAEARSYLGRLSRAPIPESAFDALDLEVRRTVRDQRDETQPAEREDIA